MDSFEKLEIVKKMKELLDDAEKKGATANDQLDILEISARLIVPGVSIKITPY